MLDRIRNLDGIETPALVLDMDAVERNIARMAGFFAGKACGLRPHCKTHKLPLIAQKQIAAGAIGITCATVREAQVMQKAGIESILIANEMVSPGKMADLVGLCRGGEVMVCVDDVQNVRDLDAAGRGGGVTIGVLVEVNVGLNRCGVAPGEAVLRLVQEISEQKNVDFRGLMGYEGGMFVTDLEEKRRKCAAANQLLIGTKEMVEKAGFGVGIVSAGGSNTYDLTGLCPGITEVQVGSFATMDSHNAAFGLDFEQALFVLTTVISTAGQGRAVTDAGKKTISSDEGMPVCVDRRLELFKLDEEHGHLRMQSAQVQVSIKDKLLLIPSHGCTTIALHDRYHMIRNGEYVGVEEILARGH